MDTINIFEKIENNDNKDLKLTLEKDTVLNIYNKYFENIEINVVDNTKVIINEFNTIDRNNTVFNIYIGTNSNLTYNTSNIINNNHSLNICIKYKGTNSKVTANIHSIVSGKEWIKVVGNVKNNNKFNELLENIKIILIDEGKCEVIPDMLISTKEVIANHKVAISKIRKEEEFYLMSKGLSKKRAQKLLEKSFLLNNIKDESIKTKIQEYYGR